MEFSLNYKLFDNDSNLKNEGEARATLDEKYLSLNVMFGEPFLYEYTDIIGISDNDYKIDLFLTSKEKLNLWGLGYQYEDFLFQLYKLRNELMVKILLMEEALLQPGFEAQYEQFDLSGQLESNGTCEIRFYDSAAVVLPQKNEPIRMPYCYISNIAKKDYTLAIANKFQGKIVLTKMGQNFDPAGKALSDAINKMILRTQQNIKDLIPEATPITINKLGSLMKDGQAAKRRQIELQAQEFWARLTHKIDDAGLSVEYEFLNSLSAEKEVCVGIKRGLMGNLTGTYIWLLFPLLDPTTKKLGNTIALEAFNSQEKEEMNDPEIENTDLENQPTADQADQGKPDSTGATYFFKMIERKQYLQTKDEDLAKNSDDFIDKINQAMIEINFRREPIYLTESQLEKTEYSNYRFAISKILSLRTLRDLFVGRVIHASKEQWKADVASLLAFNTKSVDDNEKWVKGEN